MPDPHFLSLADIGKLPQMPLLCQFVSVAVIFGFVGYMVGMIDRTRRQVCVDWKPERRPLTEAEKKAEAVLSKTIPGYDPETIEAMTALSEGLKKQASKPTTRGAQRNERGQFLPRTAK
jgi:hypothetical protein